MRAELGIWAVRVEAEKLGEALAERLGGELFRPWLGVEPQNAGPGEAESRGTESQKARFREQFGQRSQWVLVMATGIATRFVDGLLRDKHQDPAVVVLDEAGRYAVALVGGHEGGANALAYRVANAVGAIPIVTTATEAMKSLIVGIGCRKGVSEEQIERAVLHALAQRGVAGPGGGVGRGAGAGPGGGVGQGAGAGAGAGAGLSAGAGAGLSAGAGAGLSAGAGAGLSAGAGAGLSAGAGAGLSAGAGAGLSAGAGAGLGAGAGAGLGAGASAGLGAGEGAGGNAALAEVRELATVDLKANEPGLLSFSQRHGIPLRVIARHQIEGRSWVSQPSEWVRQSVGLDGVCEPCALIASTRGRLVVPKTALDGVAVAIVADEWGLVS